MIFKTVKSLLATIIIMLSVRLSLMLVTGLIYWLGHRMPAVSDREAVHPSLIATILVGSKICAVTVSTLLNIKLIGRSLAGVALGFFAILSTLVLTASYSESISNRSVTYFLEILLLPGIAWFSYKMIKKGNSASQSIE